MRYKNRKNKDLPNTHTNNARLDAELILLSKRDADARSAHRRSHGIGGYMGLGLMPEPIPTPGEQLITQLADLDLTADIRMDDYVAIRLEMPLWQVLELSMQGEFNVNLVNLLDSILDNRAGDPAYLARLNALILEAAEHGKV